MTAARDQALRALEPRLLSAAGELTRSEDQARALVSDIMAIAARADCDLVAPAQLEAAMFRLLRQRFHAVARRLDLQHPARLRRRLRLEAAGAALASQGPQGLIAPAAPDPSR